MYAVRKTKLPLQSLWALFRHTLEQKAKLLLLLLLFRHTLEPFIYKRAWHKTIVYWTGSASETLQYVMQEIHRFHKKGK
jgi:hypothetical protein